MTFTQEDLIKAKDKAAKALEKLDRIIDEMRPDFDWNEHFDTDAMTFAEQLHMPAFVEEFKPREFEVTVWIARPYVVRVSGLDEEDAVNNVRDNIHGVEFTPDPHEYRSPLAENVLETAPYDLVAEEA